MNNNRSIWEEEIRTSNNPQELWTNAIEYFRWCDRNPIQPKAVVMTGKEAGKKVDLSKIRPYQLRGLLLFCGVTEEYFRDMRKAPKDSDAYIVVSRILMNIYVQNMELALVGELSPILAAKVLNLDKEDTGPQKVTIEYVGNIPQLAESENEILQNIEIEKGELKMSKEKRDES